MESQRQFEPKLSVEFFPPKTDQGLENLKQVCSDFQPLDPSFFSVTFGAGGSTQDKTLETVSALHAAGHKVAPHLSCISSTKESLSALLQGYQAMGIERIVALRGDIPSGSMYGGGELKHANELVSFIREQSGDAFHLEVAAYPEFHPEAHSALEDLDNFQRKVEAGANSAITQYFFNADAYFRFVESCEQRGLNIPIVPGIMPIRQFKQLARFSDICGAEIPKWLRERLQSYGDDVDSIVDYGIDVITELCERLLKQGAPGLHFYCLNKSDPTLTICRNLGYC